MTNEWQGELLSELGRNLVVGLLTDPELDGEHVGTIVHAD
jgi:hypothetical protein